MNEEIKNAEIRYLGDVQRLVLKPGDTIVLTIPRPISREQAERLRTAFEQVVEGYKVLVLGDDVKIGVLGAEPE